MSLKIGVCMDFFFSIEQSYPLYGMFGNRRKPFRMYKYNLLENMFIEADSIIS